jgi:hypothetical protein
VKGRSTQIKFVFVFLFFITNSGLFAQVPAFDRLEMLFSQKHYKIVYRRANRLIDNPEYDFSKFPLYYKSISVLEMAQNPVWYGKNEKLVNQAILDLIEIRKTGSGKRIFEAHINELSSLKIDLDSWLSDIKRQGKQKEFSEYSSLFSQLFLGMKFSVEDRESVAVTNTKNPALSSRMEMVTYAQKQLGVPYVSAGDNPSGFDCSGFTCFVMKNVGKNLPRRAKDQYEASVKLKANEAMMGDLVFFSNGGEISHVGMLINEPGKPKAMIHASSSKGISIVEIESSEYWNKRVVGYGTFIR